MMKKLYLPLLLLLCAFTTFHCRKKENPVVEAMGKISRFNLEVNQNPTLQTDLIGVVNGNTILITLNQKTNLNQVIVAAQHDGEGIYVNNTRIGDNANKVDILNGMALELRLKDGRMVIYHISLIGNMSLPQIAINTQNNLPITSKTTYLNADMTIDGKKNYPDYQGSLQIKGRGNSTWGYPKKPYRLKLNVKSSILGLSSAKDWVLVANYLDGTHLLNAVGFKIAQLLNMPFTNHVIPVELTINGQYLGLYTLTEQIEVQPNRVHVGNDGLLLLLDSYYDEDWKFKSAAYQLPMMVKHPELTHDSLLTPIKTAFERVEALIAHPNFPNNNYLDEMDENSIVDYCITYFLTDNKEYNHPKSTYFYKSKTGKYHLGPVWDFDWAFGYKGPTHFTTYSSDPFLKGSNSNLVGTRFFERFVTDPRIKTLLKQRWTTFNAQQMTHLFAYIDEYALTIEAARSRDFQKWQRGSNNVHADVTALKTWLRNRADFLTTYFNSL